MKRTFSVLAILLIAIAGCAQRKIVAPTEQQSAPSVRQPSGRSEEGNSAEKVTEQRPAKIKSEELPSGGKELPAKLQDVFFAFDSYDLPEDAKPILGSLSKYLLKNGSVKVLVTGNCDERGTSEYNLALGDRRAKAAKDYLLSLGVQASRITTLSYGKEKQVCSEHKESCWAKNRRDHFVLLKN